MAGPGGSTAPPGSTEPYTFLLSPTQFYISTKPFTILLNPASFYRDQRISTEPFTFLVMSPEYFYYRALHISTEPTRLLLSPRHFYRAVQCGSISGGSPLLAAGAATSSRPPWPERSAHQPTCPLHWSAEQVALPDSHIKLAAR